jgi:hypothetical protein
MGEVAIRKFPKELPVGRWNGNHHPVVGAADFQGQLITRDLIVDFLAAMFAAQRGFDQRYRIVSQQSQAKGKQGRG